MVPEAPLEQTEHGLVPAGKGWFVLNARDARWNDRPGRRSVSFTGRTEYEAETYFPQLGANLVVIEPGVANSVYHWETEQEAFLVLSGEALLIVEGEERTLRAPGRRTRSAHRPFARAPRRVRATPRTQAPP